MAEPAVPEPWIVSERRCICSIMIGSSEPDCEVHGMDACYGRYDSYWWGRVRLSRQQETALRVARGES